MDRVGWRKQWRKTWDSPVLKGRPNHLLVWFWLLDHVMFAPGERVRFRGNIIELQPGQRTCGSNQIAKDTGVSPSTVRRILSELSDEHQIEQQHDNRCSLITVKNWTQYQSDEQQNEQQMSSKRAADEQQMSTKEEGKKVRKKEYDDVRPETKSLLEYIDTLCQETGLSSNINPSLLDELVARHKGPPLRVEVRKCLAWLVDHGKKEITTARITNWLAKAGEIAKREENRLLETRKQQPFAIDPALRAKLLPPHA